MPLEGDYEPSPAQWVRDQVEAYERSGGAEGGTLRDTGMPVVIVTTKGNKSGKIRKIPLMRVEHGGEYLLVASMGGAPNNPVWYYNLKADPDTVTVRDGAEVHAVTVRELDGDERAEWWDRAVAAYPPYAEYQTRTERRIPSASLPQALRSPRGSRWTGFATAPTIPRDAGIAQLARATACHAVG